MNIIFWDTETNGLTKHHSVLSISAIKFAFSFEGEKLIGNLAERYERFYSRKPGEASGAEAVSVNGLTDEVIRERRNGAVYPELFCNDVGSFRMFCNDTR